MLDGTVGNLGRSHVGGQGESEILISPLRAIDQSPLAHEQALDEVAYTACDFFICLTFDAPAPTPDRAERSLAREPERRDTESGSFVPPSDGNGGGASMLKLEVKTQLPEEQLKQRTKSFFKDDLGLNITAEASDCVTFAGGGGYVTAVFSHDQDATRGELETREGEEQAKRFGREVS